MTGLGLFDARHCAVCATPLPKHIGRGRPRLYCSDDCRRAARNRAYQAHGPDAIFVTKSALKRPATTRGVHTLDSNFSGAGRPESDRLSRGLRGPRSLVAIAAGIPTPVDPHFGPCRAYLSLVDHGGLGKATWRVHFALDGGRVRQPVGPALPARQAMALAELLNERLVLA